MVGRDLRFLERDAGSVDDIDATTEATAAERTKAAGGLVELQPTAGDCGGRARIGEEPAAEAIATLAAGPAVAARGHVEDQRALVKHQGRRVRTELMGLEDQIAEAAAIRDGLPLAQGPITEEKGGRDRRGRVNTVVETTALAAAANGTWAAAAALCQIALDSHVGEGCR